MELTQKEQSLKGSTAEAMQELDGLVKESRDAEKTAAALAAEVLAAYLETLLNPVDADLLMSCACRKLPKPHHLGRTTECEQETSGDN